MPAAYARRPSRGSRLLSGLKVLLFVSIPCFVWLAANVGALDEYLQALRRRDQIRSQVEKLQADTAQMEDEEGQLEKRGFADEAAARERFRLVKPGEKIVFLEWDDEGAGSARESRD